MAEETRLKSSLELAMERLRQKDAESGTTVRSLSDAEKAQIAELRNYYEARIAELQVMHQSQSAAVFDPAGRDALAAEFRAEKERLTADRDRKIEQVRAGKA
jgi:uncharacterized protein YqeY